MRIILLLMIILAFVVPAIAQVDDTPYRTDKTSPRMERLREQAAGGKTDAVAEFWVERKTNGGPLVESIPNDPQHVLLTFTYQGNSGTRGVSLVSQLSTARDFSANALTPLPGTDVWFKTFWVRNDLRFSYSFLVQETSAAPGAGAAIADPMNPRKLAPDTGVGLSYIELPGATPQPWIVRNDKNPAGKLNSEAIDSKILNGRHAYQVYQPPNFAPKPSDVPFPLLVLFDGELYADSSAIQTVETLDNLAAAGKIPRMVAVFVHQSPQPQRNVELTNNQPFLDFVTNEVLPQVRAKYHATSNPQQTVVIGSSTGGLASCYFALKRPDVYGNVLSQSGALWPGQTREDPGSEWLTHQYETAPKVPAHFVLQVGTLERWNTPGGRLSILNANRHLRDVLRAKGSQLDYSEMGGGHEPLSWRGGLAEGLIQLLGTK